MVSRPFQFGFHFMLCIFFFFWFNRSVFSFPLRLNSRKIKNKITPSNLSRSPIFRSFSNMGLLWRINTLLHASGRSLFQSSRLSCLLHRLLPHHTKFKWSVRPLLVATRENQTCNVLESISTHVKIWITFGMVSRKIWLWRLWIGSQLGQMIFRMTVSLSSIIFNFLTAIRNKIEKKGQRSRKPKIYRPPKLKLSHRKLIQCSVQIWSWHTEKQLRLVIYFKTFIFKILFFYTLLL